MIVSRSLLDPGEGVPAHRADQAFPAGVVGAGREQWVPEDAHRHDETDGARGEPVAPFER
ncbi:hypothetical protein ACFXG4_26830 [Nocardia sp. NPDC059246]|uniref:hypothetical protein n=1 Tax=unclassified Nocardia TaxID=2637762 RepID=UPI0036C6D7B9